MPDSSLSRSVAELLEQELRNQRHVHMMVSTDSMLPALVPGDQVEFAPLLERSLRPGEIVLIKLGGEWVAHRLLKASREHVLTCGDRAVRADPPLSLDQVLGRAVCIQREGQLIRLDKRWQRPGAALKAARKRLSLAARKVVQAAPQETSARRTDADLLNLSRPQEAGPTTLSQPLLEYLRREGLAELAYYHHKGDPAFDLLKKDYLATAARNLVFDSLFDAMAEVLAPHPFIPLKGVFLSRRVYPDRGLRRYGDWDVLIREEDRGTVDHALVQAGFTRSGTDDSPAGLLPSRLYRKSASLPALHLHWSLFNSSLPKYASNPGAMHRVWELATPGKQGGWEMCREHLLIHLCDHALRHSFARLIWVRDILAVLEQPGAPPDEEKWLEEARALRATGAVYQALRLLQTLLGTHLPGVRVEAFKPARSNWAARLFERRLLKGCRSSEWSFLYYWSEQESLAQRVRFVFRSLVPTRSTLAHLLDKKPETVRLADYVARWRRGWRQIRLFRSKP